LRKNSGFSLLEALIALGILGFVVISILSGFSAQLRTNRKIREKNIALTLAEDRIEQILIFSKSQLENMLTLNHDYIEDFSSYPSDDPFTKGFNPYKNIKEYKKMRRKTKITRSIVPELLNIEVTVEYGKRGNHYPFKVVLTTIRGGK